ncbi:HPP family protein [Alkalimarinus coralli]|uniref:HPP family protein n=1 Tax=Alkalimarinus coralli TaxID=2935863 RepID=UPI00202AE2FF|nr:HPP family protein [Alkalimarinus coralli]
MPPYSLSVGPGIHISMYKYWLREISLALGIEQNTTSHQEKLLSSLGGLLGIAVVYSLSISTDNSISSVFIVASMGASAVLMFAVPHGALSQPWPVVGGHTLSAAIGVFCFQSFSHTAVASACAVSLAILAMYYLRCLHPPGGATALLAVIGGEPIHSMGYSFVVTPILTNVMLLVLAAVVFNSLFKWRSYPAHGLSKSQRLKAHKRSRRTHGLTQEDFVTALQQLDSFIDVTAEDLSEIFEQAMQHTRRADTTTTPDSIVEGHHYSNGQLGINWSVRLVTGVSRRRIYYKVVGGQDCGKSSNCSRNEFSIWARYRVIPHNQHWVRDVFDQPKGGATPCKTL